ncbi:MAG: hypothetical protein KDA86_19110 [Planctomycetaceae bacterium]|nr:hypothetical protein [Planctomycetaceae bacterium]
MRLSRVELSDVLVAGLVCLVIGCDASDRGAEDFTAAAPAEMAEPFEETNTESIEFGAESYGSDEPDTMDGTLTGSAASIPDILALEDEPEVIEPLPAEPTTTATSGSSTFGGIGGLSTTSRGGTSGPRIKGGTFPSPRNWQPPGVSYTSKSAAPVEINAVESLADEEIEPPVAEVPVIEPMREKPAEPSPIQLVDAMVSKLKSGNVAYNAPDSMHYKETRVMELLLSPKESPELLEAQLTDRRNAVSEAVQHVAPRMEAALTGKGFEIEPLDPEIQFVSSLRPTRWRWRVTPNSHGPQELNFSLDAHLDLGGDGVYSIRSFDKVINVEITLREQVTEYVTANWQWLWGTLILPIVGLRMKYRRKRRRDDDWGDRDHYDDRDRMAA